MDAAIIVESSSTAARSRALVASGREAIGRSRERIECTARLISKTHQLPGFQLCSQEVEPQFRAEALDASLGAAQQRAIDRELAPYRGDR